MSKVTWAEWQTLSRAVCTGTVHIENQMKKMKANGDVSEWHEERLKELENARKILDAVTVEY